MQVYELARRSVLAQGKSVSQVSRELGLDWRTVKKMTREPVPPGYRLGSPRPRPVLGPYLERIQEMLDHRYLTGYYPRLTLAPGQTLASKGGYLVRFTEPAGTQVVADGEWMVP